MKPLFELSANTQRIVSMFRNLSINAETSFAQASEIVGFEMRSTTTAYHSARHIVLRDHGIVIEGIRGFGFVRVNGSGMVKKGHRTMAHLRRASRRGALVAETAIRQNLTRGEMIEVTEQLSRFRILETTSQSVRAASNRKIPEEPEPETPFNSRAALRSVHS